MMRLIVLLLVAVAACGQVYRGDVRATGVVKRDGPPANPQDGDIWYDTTAGKMMCRENGSTELCGTNTGVFPVGATLVFEGDSLTASTTEDCDGSTIDVINCDDWPTQFSYKRAAVSSVNKYNFAVPGNAISHLQDRYLTSVHPLSPAVTGNPGWLFVWVGANDYRNGGNSQIIIDALTSYWAAAKSDGWTLVAFTIQRRGDDGNDGGTGGNNKTRNVVNQWIRSQYKYKYDLLVDVDYLFPNPWDSQFFMPDRIHQNQNGKYYIAQYVASVMSSRGVGSPTSDINGMVIGTGSGNLRSTPESLSIITTGSNNSAYGVNSLLSATSASHNVAIGHRSMLNLQSGIQNVAVGAFTGQGLTTGGNNISIGFNTNNALTTGSNNIAIGSEALSHAVTQGSSVAIGQDAARWATDGNTTVIGFWAGRNGTSLKNSVVIGNLAGQNTGAAQGLTLIGTSSGINVTGNLNVCAGASTCATLTTGVNNTAIGANADIGSSTSYATQLGTGTNTTSNSLQFMGWNFLDSNGNGKLASLNLNPGATLRPACSVSNRGTVWQTYGAAGVADTLAVCAKDASDAYAWRTIY